jgi:hypothetical protein
LTPDQIATKDMIESFHGMSESEQVRIVLYYKEQKRLKPTVWMIQKGAA